jgi:hypothetical protein
MLGRRLGLPAEQGHHCGQRGRREEKEKEEGVQGGTDGGAVVRSIYS